MWPESQFYTYYLLSSILHCCSLLDPPRHLHAHLHNRYIITYIRLSIYMMMVAYISLFDTRLNVYFKNRKISNTKEGSLKVAEKREHLYSHKCVIFSFTIHPRVTISITITNAITKAIILFCNHCRYNGKSINYHHLTGIMLKTIVKGVGNGAKSTSKSITISIGSTWCRVRRVERSVKRIDKVMLIIGRWFDRFATARQLLHSHGPTHFIGFCHRLERGFRRQASFGLTLKESYFNRT